MVIALAYKGLNQVVLCCDLEKKSGIQEVGAKVIEDFVPERPDITGGKIRGSSSAKELEKF